MKIGIGIPFSSPNNLVRTYRTTLLDDDISYIDVGNALTDDSIIITYSATRGTLQQAGLITISCPWYDVIVEDPSHEWTFDDIGLTVTADITSGRVRLICTMDDSDANDTDFNYQVEVVKSGVLPKVSGWSVYWAAQPFLSDICNYDTINTNKWEVSQPAGMTDIEQRNALSMYANGIPYVSGGYDTVRFKDTRDFGVWSYSIMDIKPSLSTYGNRYHGLFNSDLTSGIYFDRLAAAPGYLRLNIKQNGSVVYQQTTSIIDFAIIKIIKSVGHLISVYYWFNDAWVQIGTDQTYAMTELSFKMYVANAYFSKIAVRDIIVTDTDLTGLFYKNVINALDIRDYGAIPDGATDCSDAINAALIDGNIVIQNGYFAIDESIKIPSNRIVYLKNGKLKLNDACYDNLFRNENFEDGNINIAIKGKGNFALDGNGAGNDDGYVTHGGQFAEFSYKYNLMTLVNINSLELSYLDIVDRMHYGPFSCGITNGVYKNIYQSYPSWLANGDQFVFGWGCNNISVKNIRTWGSDDFSCLGAGITGGFTPKFIRDNPIGDIHDISYENIIEYNGYSLCPILIATENHVYNISFSNVIAHSTKGIIYSDYGPTYNDPDTTKDNIHDITFNDIVINNLTGGTVALNTIGQSCRDIIITNLTNNTGKKIYTADLGLDVEDFYVNGYLYPVTAPSGLTVTPIVDGNQLDWTDNYDGNAEGFEIWVSVNGGVFGLLDTVGGGITTYDDLVSEGTLIYEVRAFVGLDFSDFSATAGDPSMYFITTWQTENAGSATKTIVIPTTGSGYDCYINFDDIETIHYTGTPGDITYVFPTTGIKTVKIVGTFPRIYFNNVGDKLKILTIEQWGVIVWSNFAGAFYGCANLTGTYTDKPVLSGVTSTANMFYNCTSFNSTVDDWDLSHITNTTYMFYGCSVFNQPVNSLDVSKVQYFNSMLRACSVFNQPVSNWNTVEATTFKEMFYSDPAFNQSVANFNVALVTDMTNMFNGANAISTANYDAILISWAAQAVKNSVAFHAGDATYTQTLVDSGTTDGTTANKLVDSTQNFLTTVSVGDVVRRTVIPVFAIVTNVDSNSVLSLSVDIMTSGKAYTIQHSDSAKARAHLVLTHLWTISDGGSV